MMSCLCQPASNKSACPNELPSRSPLETVYQDILSSQQSSNNGSSTDSSNNHSNCCSRFTKDRNCVFQRVPSRLISGTATGSFRSSVGGVGGGVSDAKVSMVSQCAMLSPCCDVDDIEPISVDELALSLDRRPAPSDHRALLPVAAVVDCRGFVSFNTNHVTSAFNASCGDRFARKRLLDGKSTVADLVSCGPETSACDARDRYRRLVKMAVSDGSAIVAYDDNTTDVTSLPVTHPLRLITEYLRKTGAAIRFLFGGLQAFHAAYPTLCSKPNEPPSRPLLYSPTTPLVELDVDSAQLSEILPHLFIGNERDAGSRTLLDTNSINHVLNVTAHIPLHFENDVSMKSKRLPATDNGRQNLKQYFEEAITFIESVRCSGDRVIVHCQAGVSRSPTIVLAYLMARYNISMMAAFGYVKSRRNVVAPNFNFMGQLMEFEQRCLAGELKHCLRDDVPPVPLCLPIASETS